MSLLIVNVPNGALLTTWHCDIDETKDHKTPIADPTSNVENSEAPSILAASLRIVREYLAFYAVLGIADLVERRTRSAWQLQALHTVTWLSSSILFINLCYSSWALVGAISQWATPAHLRGTFRMDHYNPSPWGPIGAVVEHGLAGKLISRTLHNMNAEISRDRLVGCDLAQLLQVRVPVCLRYGHPPHLKPETQSSSQTSKDRVLVSAVWRNPLLRFVYAARPDAAKQRAPLFRSSGRCGCLPGHGVRCAG